VPVVFDGIDEVGMEMIGGVQEWIRWIAEKGEHDEIVSLSETGGRESEMSEDAKPVFWKPSFVFQHGRKGGLNGIVHRGNVLTEVSDERKEVIFSKACPAKEIERMRSENGDARVRDDEDEEGERERGDVTNGVSVEGEFAFTRAVGDFCRKAVRAGRYRGNYRFNLKGQMEQRAWVKEKTMQTKKVVMVGGSQLGRMRDEIARMDGSGVSVEKMVRMRGQVTDEAVDQALSELAVLESHPDAFVVGGPGNSLMVHGNQR
jgi:hypothetical protein